MYLPVLHIFPNCAIIHRELLAAMHQLVINRRGKHYGS